MQPALRAVVDPDEMEWLERSPASPDAPNCSGAYLGQGPVPERGLVPLPETKSDLASLGSRTDPNAPNPSPSR